MACGENPNVYTAKKVGHRMGNISRFQDAFQKPTSQVRYERDLASWQKKQAKISESDARL